MLKKLKNLFSKKQSSSSTTNKGKPTWVDAQYINNPREKEEFLLGIEGNETNPIDLHFTYNQLIDLYYKERDNWDDAINNCIEICKRDIELYPKFLSADIKQHNKLWKKDKRKPKYQPPRIPFFQRLAIIYDKQGEYQKAIDVCQQAIEYKLDDNTKSGFEGRIERLKKKQSQSN